MTRRQFTVIVGVFVMLLAACNSAAGPTSSAPEQASETSTSVAAGLIQSVRFDDVYFGLAGNDGSGPECPQRSGTITPTTPHFELSSVREWVEIPLGELTDLLASSPPDKMDSRFMRANAEALGTASTSTVFLWPGRSAGSDEWRFDPAFSTLIADLDGSRALVALDGSGISGVGDVRKIVVETIGGGVTVVDYCRQLRLAALLVGYADHLSASSPYEVMRHIAAEADALAAFGRWAG